MQAECSVCASHDHLLCSGCAFTLTLRSRISLLKARAQLNEAQSAVNQTFTSAHSNTFKEQLQLTKAKLESKISQTQNEYIQKTKQITSLRKQLKLHKQELSGKTEEIDEFKMKLNLEHTHISQSLTSYEGIIETQYRDALFQAMQLQLHNCQDLIEIFRMKKRKRKTGGVEILIGQNVVPDLLKLNHYSVAVVNSGIDRVCSFITHLTHYLSLNLPFEIVLPQTQQPKVLIGPYREQLALQHSIKTIHKSAPSEYHKYCRSVSMLALDVAYLAAKIGVQVPNEASVISKMGQLLVQCSLVLENCITQQSYIKIHAHSMNIDLDSLQDYIVTNVDMEINGTDAEWSVL